MVVFDTYLSLSHIYEAKEGFLNGWCHLRKIFSMLQRVAQ